jgi:acyl-CoA synthetase (AMP-forming)/AMP-acid ligase II
MEPVPFVADARSLPELLARACWVHESRRCLTLLDRSQQKAYHATFGAVGRASRAIRDGITAHGLAGVPLGLLSRNSAAWVLVDFAAAWAGAQPVGLHVAWPVDELAFVVRDAGVQAVFVEPSQARRLAAALAPLPPSPLSGGSSGHSVRECWRRGKFGGGERGGGGSCCCPHSSPPRRPPTRGAQA